MTAAMQYEVVTSEGTSRRTLPFVISVLGDFAGDHLDTTLADRSFIDVTSVDQSLAEITPRLSIRVDNQLPGFSADYLDVELRFRTLADFDPPGVLRQVPTLLTLREKRTTCPAELLRDWDLALSRQLYAIMHHDRFQRLESCWRGLAMLRSHIPPDGDLMVRLLAATREELNQEAAQSDVSQSSLLDKLDAEISSPAVLVADYFFGRHPQDIQVLSHLAEVGSMCSCVVAAAATPQLLGQESWRDVIHLNSSQLERSMSGPECAKWNSLRGSEDSRSLALLAPGLLARPLFGELATEGDDFLFDETSLAAAERKGIDEQHVWMNPAFVLACQIANCHRRTAWCAEVTASGTAGWINEEFPWCECPTDEKVSRRLPLQAGISQPEMIRAWSELGLVPVTYDRSSERVSLGQLQTVHKPPVFSGDVANQSARLTNSIACGLILARLSNYLQVIVRDRSGAGEWASLLQDWLDQYVSPTRPATITAEKPLAEASVSIEQSRQWGPLAQVQLRPWLEDGELPAPVQIAIPVRF